MPNISDNLKSALDYLSEAQTLPDNTSVDSTNEVKLGEVNGKLEIVIDSVAVSDLTDTKVLTVAIHAATTEGGSYAIIGTPVTYTASGGTGIPALTELGRFIIPTDAAAWIKAVITTDDATPTGTLNIYAKELV